MNIKNQGTIYMTNSPANYLFVGSHNDDIEISAMGTLIKLLKEGNEVYFLVLSKTEGQDSLIRDAEQMLVINELIKLYQNFHPLKNADFLDGKLTNHELEIRDLIESYIDFYNIDIIFTHYDTDTHPDHTATARAIEMAGRKISIIQWESPNVFNFIPNYFVELQRKNIDEKIRYMKFHKSQNIKNNNFYLNKIKAVAEFRGQAVYYKYAEAFFIKRLKA